MGGGGGWNPMTWLNSAGTAISNAGHDVLNVADSAQRSVGDVANAAVKPYNDVIVEGTKPGGNLNPNGYMGTVMPVATSVLGGPLFTLGQLGPGMMATATGDDKNRLTWANSLPRLGGAAAQYFGIPGLTEAGGFAPTVNPVAALEEGAVKYGYAGADAATATPDSISQVDSGFVGNGGGGSLMTNGNPATGVPEVTKTPTVFGSNSYYTDAAALDKSGALPFSYAESPYYLPEPTKVLGSETLGSAKDYLTGVQAPIDIGATQPVVGNAYFQNLLANGMPYNEAVGALPSASEGIPGLMQNIADWRTENITNPLTTAIDDNLVPLYNAKNTTMNQVSSAREYLGDAFKENIGDPIKDFTSGWTDAGKEYVKDMFGIEPDIPLEKAGKLGMDGEELTPSDNAITDADLAEPKPFDYSKLFKLLGGMGGQDNSMGLYNPGFSMTRWGGGSMLPEEGALYPAGYKRKVGRSPAEDAALLPGTMANIGPGLVGLEEYYKPYSILPSTE